MKGISFPNYSDEAIILIQLQRNGINVPFFVDSLREWDFSTEVGDPFKISVSPDQIPSPYFFR